MYSSTKSRLFNMCNIYMLLWMLYSFHWFEVVNTPVLNALSNVFLGINLALSIYYCFYCLFHYQLPRLLYIVFSLLLLFVIYGTLSVLSGEEIYIRLLDTRLRNGSYMIGPLRSFLPLFAFYYFCKRGLLNKTSVIIWGGISLLQFIFVFMNSNAQYEVGEFVNNNAYHFTVLLPLLFFIRRPKIVQLLLLLALIILVLLGMKRGAMLSTFFFVFYYIYINMRHASLKRKVIVVVIASILIGVGLSYLDIFYENSSILQRRLDNTLEGSSSGRDLLYKRAWVIWSSQSSFIQMVFGHGASGSLKLLDNYIHNDFLEMLIDTGIVGLVAYVAFWISFILTWIKSQKDELIYAVLGAYIVVLLSRSIYGMMYSNLQPIASMTISYCLCQIQYNNQSLNNQSIKPEESINRRT